MNQIVPPNRKARRVRDAMMSHAAPVALALEPRYMFDAAGAATGVDAVREATAEATAVEHDGASGAENAGDDAALAAASAAHQLPADDGTEAPAAVAPEPQRKEVVFIDAGVEDHEALAAAVGEGVEVVILDAAQDGLARMAAWADGKRGYDAIHVMSHGAEGTVQLGTLTLTSKDVADRAADLAALGGALGEAGDIMLYGCTVGANAAGQAFLGGLSAATGADIAASDDPTGSAVLGGDWDLEATSGTVETDALEVHEYQGALQLAGSTATLTFGGSGMGSATVDGNREFDFGSVYVDINDTAKTITLYTQSLGTWNSNFVIGFSGGVLGEVTSISQTGGTSSNAGDYSTAASVTGADNKSVTLNITGLTRNDGTIVFSYVSTGGNVNPSITGLPSDVTVTEETASNLDLSAATVSDDDAADILTVTLTANSGTMTASSGGSVTVGGSTTGTLTLQGTAANIDTYLNTASNIQYTGASNVSGDNAATVTVTVQDNNGSPVVNAGTVNLDITDINDAPTVSANASQPTGGFTEGGAAQQLFNLDSISTIESTQTVSSFAFSVTGLQDGASEVVTIDGQDFALDGGGGTVNGHTVGIAGGTVTVTFGTGQSTANAVTFIDAVTYKNTSENPTAGNRVFTLNSVRDSGGTTGTGAADTVNPNIVRTIGVTAVNDNPTGTGLPAGPIAAPEETATNIDLSALTLADLDGDVSVTLKLGVSNGTLAAATGVAGVTVGGSGTARTLTGTVSAINTYLDTASNITYTGNTNYVGTDTLTVAVTDNGNTGSGGGTDQAIGSITLNVTNVNDAPTVATNTGMTVNEGATNTAITAAMLATTDVDTGDTLTYTVTALPANGSLSVNGTPLGVNGTFTQTQIAAGQVTYTHNGSETTTDSFTFTVSDGNGGSIGATAFAITVTAQNDAPVFSGLNGTPAYTEDGTAVQLDADVAISDAELNGSSFNGASLTIARNGGANASDTFANTGNLGVLTQGGNLVLSGETIGTVTTNSGGTLVLTFNASANTAKVTEVMRSLTYANSSNEPPATAQLDWTFNDGNAGAQGAGGALTATGSTTVTITAVNDTPTVTPAGAQPTGGFTEGGAAQQLFDLDAISTVESAQRIASFAFTFTGAVDGASDVVTIGGTDFPLNGTGGTVGAHNVAISGGTVTVTFGTVQTVANAVTFIDAITYKNISENPTAGNRVFTLSAVTDNGGGAATVNPGLARTVAVTPVNDAPVIANLAFDTQTFSIGGAGVVIDTGTALALTDVDNTTLASATVTVLDNYTSTEDVLALATNPATMGNITASYSNGTLTLTSAGATATHAEWAAALAAVTYQNTNTDVGTINSGDRRVAVTVNDGNLNSLGASVTISIVAAPVIDLDGNDSSGATNGGMNAAFTEGGAAVAIVDADATLTDDGANLNQLVISLTNAQTGDIITLNGRTSGDVVNGITITYNSASQITLSGSATKADYLALMQEARFSNTSDAPNTTPRTITFTARDTDNNTGSAVTATVSVTAVDDQPTIGGTVANQAVNDTATVSPFSGVTLTEVDGENVTVTITPDTAAKGSFTTLNGFTSVGGGSSYTFTGTAAAAQTAIQGMVFTPTANRVAPGLTETTTFTISVEDADGTTDPVTDATTTVVSTSVNTAPAVGNVGGETSAVVAGGSATALGLAGDAAIADVDSPDFNGGSLVITQGSGTTNGNWGVDGTTVTAGGDGVLAAGEIISVGGVAIGTVHATNTGQATSLEITFNANATPARVQTLVQNLTYAAPSGLGARAFTLTLNDGDTTANGGDADTAVTFTINVQPNPPVVTGLDGGSVTFTEGGPAVRLDANGDAAVTDADSANFNGGTITVSITSGGTNAEDVLKVLDNATDGVSVAGANVSVGGTVVATFTGGTGGTPLTLTMNTDATPARMQLVLRNIGYENTNGNNPSTANRTVSVVMTDGSGATSTASTVTVGVTAVNDAPVITGGTINTTNTEHTSSYVFAGGFITGITDADAGNSFANARVIVDIDSTGANPYLNGDQLSVLTQGNVTYSLVNDVGQLSYTGLGKIADVAWDASTGTMTITFVNSAAITGAVVTDVMNRVVFWTTNDDPTQKGTTPNRTISVTLEDGGNVGSGTPTWPTRTGTITITDVNDTGTVTVGNTAAPVFQSTPVTVAPNLTLADVDDTQVTEATISIVTPPDGAAETLTLTGTFGTISAANISGSGTGTITITGSHALADIQAAMRAVQYSNSAGNATLADRTVRFSTQERGAAGASADATVSINAVPVIAVNAGVPVAEGDAVTVTPAMLSATDANHGPAALTFTVGRVPANGSVLLNGTALAVGGTFTQADLVAGRVSYRHNGSETTADSFTVTVGDGLATTAASTVSITITPTNDVPVANPGLLTPLDGQNGTALSYPIPSGLFTDSDGETLTVEASGLPNGLALSPDGTRITGIPSGPPGTYTVVLTARDGAGAEVSATFTMTITAAPQAPTGAPPLPPRAPAAPPGPPGPPPGLNPPGLGDTGTPVAAGLNGGTGQGGDGARSPVTGGLGSQSPIDNSGSPVKTGLGTNSFGTGSFSPSAFYGAGGFGNRVFTGGTGGLNQALNGGFGAGGVFGGGAGGGQGGGLGGGLGGGFGGGAPAGDGGPAGGNPGQQAGQPIEGQDEAPAEETAESAEGQPIEGEIAILGAPGFTSRLAILHQQFDAEADQLARAAAELENKAPSKVA